MNYLLGIDIGTSGTKTVLFDENANVISSSTEEYPLYTPQNGYAEQDANDWWNAVVVTIKNVLQQSKVSAGDIKGVGLSGQMHGLVLLDEQNNVLRKSIIWCDTRTSKECEEITEKVGKERLIEITANPALPGFTASKIMWVKNNEPEIYEKTAHILLPKDYIRFKLTGEYATEVSDASGMQLLDVPKRCWSDEVLQKLDIDKALLAKVYESHQRTGEISEEAASLTGLSKGTIVAGGAGDNAAAAVGTGVVCDGMAFTTIGTSGVVYAHSSQVTIDKNGRVHTFCSAVDNEWHVMGVTQAAGLSLKWFKDNFCFADSLKARENDVDVYYILDKMAEQVPIGANKLIYLPYLNGERTPHLDVNCRGSFIGLSSMHTRYDLLRAVMEGVSYSLKDCLEILDQMGVVPQNMLVCGGGGTSSFWRQMIADVFGLPVATVVSKEGPALGVAILAGVACGLYCDVKSACKALIKLNPVQQAVKTNTKKYDGFYKIYKMSYLSLKGNFEALAQL